MGESIHEYTVNTEVSIGVNDVNKFFPDTPADYLVCVDLPSIFTPERQRTIIESVHKKFFTHLSEWSKLVQRCQLFKLDKFPGCLEGLDTKDVVSYSNNSAFVATVIAYKMGATDIVLYGVDFVNHHHLSRTDVLKKQILDFKNLYDALQKRGVKLSVCSQYSELSKCIPVGK